MEDNRNSEVEVCFFIRTVILKLIVVKTIVTIGSLLVPNCQVKASKQCEFLLLNFV